MKVANPFLLFLTLPYIAFANVCTSNTPVTEVSGKPDVSCTHITAQKQIKLEPGFIFKASGTDATNTFSAHIDPGLLYPPTHGLTKNSDGTLSDGGSGFAVGSIPYEYSVSNSGAAMYNIPIECPEGINGMEPKVSLVYNSQAGDGVMGWGWSIGGLSAITRVNKNQHFDGKTESISFTSDDALALDGQRLLKYTTENGGIWYKTESEDFNKIVAYDIQYWGPKYFKVYTKEGYTMTYGSESGDVSGYYMLSKESDYIYNIAWYLTEIVDSNGNKITYKYSTQQKNAGYINNRISQIVYGKNKNTNSGFETIIRFQYNETIPQPVPTYISGKRLFYNACLSSVQIINGGSVKSTYSIKYSTVENKKQVTEIGYEKNGVKVGSTKFDWARTQYAHSLNAIMQLPIEQSKLIQGFSYDKTSIISRSFGDFEGDGLSDMFVICQFRNKKESKYVCMLLHNTGLGYEISEEKAYGNTLDIATYYFLDDDNDGSDEFFIIDKKSCAFSIWRFKWNKSSSRFVCDVSSVWHNVYNYNNYGFKRGISPVVGDFYGNGSAQIIVKVDEIIGTKVTETRFVDTDGAPYVRYIPTINDYCKVFVTDVNGNGKSDLTIVTSGGAVTVFEESNGYFMPIQYDKQSPLDIAAQSVMSLKELGFNTKDEIYQGDFNGDGNTDLLVCKSSSKKWLLYISDGTSYVNYESDLPLMNNCKYHERVFVTDVNSDGKSDLIVKEEFCDVCADYYTEDLYGNVTLPYSVLSKRGRVLISTGTNFVETLVFNPDNFEGANLAGYVSDKDKEEYISYCNKTSNNLSRHSFTRNKYSDKIISVTDGMGKTLKLSYGSMGDRSMDTPTYQIGSKDPNDVSILNRCQWNVVTAAQIKCGGKTLSSYEYNYSNACLDKKGKGFLGYQKTVINNYTNSTTTTTEYDLNKKYKFVYPIRQTVTNNGQLVKEISNTYNLRSYSGKRYCMQPKSITENDNLNGLQTATEFVTYDSYGNILNKRVKKGDLTITEDISYTKAGHWCPRLPTYIKTTRTYNGESESDERYMSYDSKGNLTYDYDMFVTKRYSNFDGFGHAQTTTYTADGKTRTEKVTYTPSGRNIASKTNILGETTTSEWNESDGTLTSETDHYGRKTSYRYDGLGRRIETIYPDGRRSVSSLLWAGSSNSFGASYYQYSETSGQSPRYVWFTSDGKEICKQSYGLGGRLVSVFKEYNNDGTVSRVSAPTFTSNAEKWETRYNYDSHQRPIQITAPSGITTIQYNGRTTVTISPTTRVEQILSAEGWKESIVTNGKAVSYTYYPSGLVKSVTPEGGKAVELEYNKQGKRTKLADPDGGTVNETYNVFGELTSSERDIAEGRKVKTTLTYTNNGMLIQKNIGGDIIRYTYDGSNRLQRKDYGATHSVEYQYDGFDRVTETREMIEGREYKTKTTYDFFGRVKEETFPTGYVVRNRYDDYGNLLSQTDVFGNRVYEALTADAKGRILSEGRNNKVTEYTYDSHDNLTNIRASGVLDLQYAYRSTNHLPFSVSDRKAGYRQEYYFDDQNRLTSWPIFRITEGSPIQTNYLEYDGNNNISSRSAFGECDIEYNNEEHPHAISGINGVPDVMPKTDLNISYTNFSKVEQIDEGANHYTIVYGVDQNRVKSILKTAAGETTRYYLPNYEEVITPLGASEKIHYLCGGAVMVEKGGQWNLYYCYGDRLGSIVAVTDKEGNVVERYAYTPWGERRNPKDWTKPDRRTVFFTNRGFTGHEHLDAFNLIDMGGRVYDPMLGSFLSIDPYIQAPDNWLNYNRYLYCYGNPLIYTDPSGEMLSALAIIGISTLIGTLVGTVSAIQTGVQQGLVGKELTEHILLGGVIGAACGAVGGAVGYGVSAFLGEVVSSTFMGAGMIGATSGATTGFLNGSISTWINGGSFGAGILAGVKAGMYGAMSGFVLGGLVQGVTNSFKGNNFWTGEAIGKSAPSTGSSASSAASQSEKFPPNDGALGSWHEETLQPGTVVDRYGGTGKSSVFASPEGTSLDARSLLEDPINGIKYDVFKIIKPVRVKSSIIAPWNGHAGGGIQYKFERPILELMDHGFIIKINK